MMNSDTRHPTPGSRQFPSCGGVPEGRGGSIARRPSPVGSRKSRVGNRASVVGCRLSSVPRPKSCVLRPVLHFPRPERATHNVGCRLNRPSSFVPRLSNDEICRQTPFLDSHRHPSKVITLPRPERAGLTSVGQRPTSKRAPLQGCKPCIYLYYYHIKPTRKLC